MSKSKATYTKGPWKVSSFMNYPILKHSIIDEENNIICATRGYEGDRAKANAQLIAAAPALLEFAKHILEQINSGACGYIDGTEARLKSYVEQLIAKAEGGETEGQE
jgi:hypothetical protein